jgi:hypothetical protein
MSINLNLQIQIWPYIPDHGCPVQWGPFAESDHGGTIQRRSFGHTENDERIETLALALIYCSPNFLGQFKNYKAKQVLKDGHTKMAFPK